MSLAEDLLRSKVPTLGWDRFSVVKRWIADTSTNASNNVDNVA
jgi:hypothetical protein